MPNPWRDKVLAYNARRKVQDDKASDLDVLVRELLALPPGQRKHVMTDAVRAVLRKHGYTD